MSEQTLVAGETDVAEVKSPTPTVAVNSSKPPLTFEVEEFEEGDFKGFKFNSPQYNGNEGLTEAISTYGLNTVLSVFNAAITARIRTKVKNSLPKNIKPNELLAKQKELVTKYPDSVLFSEDDAKKWRPELRELTPNQLFKKSKAAFEEIAKDLAAGTLQAGTAQHVARVQEATNYLMDIAKLQQQ